MAWNKLIVLIIIASGESLMILAQVYGARAVGVSTPWEGLKLTHWYGWVAVAGTLVVLAGYFYGITVFRNIWLVTLTSWTSLVVAEIAIAWLAFRTVPTGATLIGFVLVLAGFITANLTH